MISRAISNNSRYKKNRFDFLFEGPYVYFHPGKLGSVAPPVEATDETSDEHFGLSVNKLITGNTTEGSRHIEVGESARDKVRGSELRHLELP